MVLLSKLCDCLHTQHVRVKPSRVWRRVDLTQRIRCSLFPRLENSTFVHVREKRLMKIQDCSYSKRLIAIYSEKQTSLSPQSRVVIINIGLLTGGGDSKFEKTYFY